MLRSLATVVLLGVWAEAGLSQEFSSFQIASLNVTGATAPLNSWPVVTGGFVAWGGPSGIESRFLLETQATTIVPTAYSPKDLRAGGGVIVWADYRNGSNNSDIFGYDPATKQQFTVREAPGNQSNPAVGSDYIVWQESGTQAGTCALWAMNRANGSVFKVQDNVSDLLYPNVGGRYALWGQNATSLYACDLQTGQKFQVSDTAETWYEGFAAVSGDFVVWTDSRSIPTGEDIYAKNLLTGEESPICTAPWPQGFPSIDGNIVVWKDGRDHRDAWGTHDTDIYGYDLSTGQEFPIRVGPGSSFVSPQAISGNLVVWGEEHYVDGHYFNIYGAYVPEPGCLGLLLIGGLAALRRRR